ncbi:hypothetical protein P171DRAFT_444773 [Karstenula rhodostoma CBS 690.94]|uniref:Uncharacterized protein n=1 Tax=Karstenula rhodostoma CBS 690.94 TaxID=1392251 RepID=A0A9P4PE24_9PLEO|nr:hypothetical protein P171DRAFT_444773 [Karstenula rhodostoma CBS 690.94]
MAALGLCTKTYVWSVVASSPRVQRFVVLGTHRCLHRSAFISVFALIAIGKLVTGLCLAQDHRGLPDWCIGARTAAELMALSYPTCVYYVCHLVCARCLSDTPHDPSFKRTVKIHLSRFYVETEYEYFFGLDISRASSLIDPLLQTSYWRCPLSASPLEQGHSPVAGNRRRLFHPDSLPAEDANRYGVVLGRPRQAARSMALCSRAPSHLQPISGWPCSWPSYARIGWPRAAVSYRRGDVLRPRIHARSIAPHTDRSCVFPSLFGYRSAVPGRRCTLFE